MEPMQSSCAAPSGRRKVFTQGMRDAIPIGLGYLAVSFSLGIAARRAGLNPFQGFLASALCNASAGEYAGFTVIAACAGYLEIAVITLVANARYLLMSCAMSQRLSPETSLGHRLLMAFDITDELFAIAIARPGPLNPYYTYGGMLTCIPCWATGTALGIVAGELMPLRVVSALSVALYGMFLAVVIPRAKQDKVVAVLVIASFATSYACQYLPTMGKLSAGTRTILLTVGLSALGALLFPYDGRKEKHDGAE